MILEAEVEWRREEAGGLHSDKSEARRLANWCALRNAVIRRAKEERADEEYNKPRGCGNDNLLKQDETDPLVSPERAPSHSNSALEKL